MTHPLLNPTAKHYDTKEKPKIYYTEQKLTVREMIGACKFNIEKYDREKGQDEKDKEKIKDYTRYLNFLLDLLSSDPSIEYMSVQYAYDYLGIDLSYEV